MLSQGIAAIIVHGQLLSAGHNYELLCTRSCTFVSRKTELMNLISQMMKGNMHYRNVLRLTGNYVALPSLLYTAVVVP